MQHISRVYVLAMDPVVLHQSSKLPAAPATRFLKSLPASYTP